jgi:tetrahydromethanopterin S-methyltransferase subunit E
MSTLDELTRVLQASISPVALVSGVGLLILSLTNRFGRVTDRLRELAASERSAPGGGVRVGEQIQIFLRRARLLRAAISCAAACALLAGVEVLLIFGMAVFYLQLHHLVLFCFALSLLGLIAALLLFLADLNLSLRAVETELHER